MSSKQREALNQLLGLIDNEILVFNDGLDASEVSNAQYQIDKADEAHSEPLRNCDIGTVEEQDERFKNFCLSYYEPCNVDGECWKCPLFKTKARCPIAWAQMPYESEVK